MPQLVLGKRIRAGRRHVCLMTSAQPYDFSRFYDKEAASLLKAGHRVTALGLEPQVAPRPLPGLEAKAVRPRHGADKLGILLRMARLARELQADVYHCYDPWSLAIGLWLRRQRPQTVVVYDSTEWFPRIFLDRRDVTLALRMLGYLLVRVAERVGSRDADGIIETTQTRARRFTRRGRRISLVFNTPPLGLVPFVKEQREPWIAYTGLICYHRGFDVLLRATMLAARSIPEIRLVVAGRFAPGEDIREWTEGYISQSEMKDRIKFLGWLPSYRAILNSLAPCSLGSLLFQEWWGNDYSNLPTKLFDYMAAGIAVLASPWPEMGRIVSETGCGWLVDPSSPDAVAEAIVKALSDQTDCRARGIAGRRAAQVKYNWAADSAVLLGLYSALVG